MNCAYVYRNSKLDAHSRYEMERKEVTQCEAEIEQLTGLHAQLLEDERALRNYLERIKSGDLGDPQAHIRHKAIPEPPPPNIARLMDFWAAVSGALFVIAYVLLVSFNPQRWLFWLILVVLVYGLIESALRHKLVNYLLTATFVLATITAVLVLVDYWYLLIPAALLIVFTFSLLMNLRELRARRRS